MMNEDELPQNKPNRIINWLLRQFFKMLYTRIAWSYDLIAAFVSLNRWQAWGTSILKFIKGKNVLELGCGTGHLQTRLIESGYCPIGIDISSQMVRLASHRIKRFNPNKYQPVIVCGSAMRLPFVDEAFENIVSTFPTAYIFAADALSEIHRVMTTNGLFVVLISAWITGKSLPERAMAWFFKLTGQSPPEGNDLTPLLKQLDEAGIDAQLIWRDICFSRILFIYGVKKKARSDLVNKL
jgi:ubiquinone/menaquinone biosynthesis C-methylase UbiE